jgi:hypothetical protein
MKLKTLLLGAGVGVLMLTNGVESTECQRELGGV